MNNEEVKEFAYQICKCGSLTFTEVTEYSANQKKVQVRNDGKVLRRNADITEFSEVDIAYRCDSCGDYYQLQNGTLVSF